MKHYKHGAKVVAFESDGSQDHLITSGMVEMTDAELDAHKNPPIPERTIQQKIDDLENSVTPRNYREFVLGVQYSIDKINKVDAAIELLRAEL